MANIGLQHTPKHELGLTWGGGPLLWVLMGLNIAILAFFFIGPKTAKSRFMADDHTKTLRVGGEVIRWVWVAHYWGSIGPLSQFIGYNCPFSYLEVEVTCATCPISRKTVITVDFNGSPLYQQSNCAFLWCCRSILKYFHRLDSGFLMWIRIGAFRAKKASVRGFLKNTGKPNTEFRPAGEIYEILLI